MSQRDGDNDLIDLLAVIWRYRKFIAVVTVAAAIVAAAAFFVGEDPGATEIVEEEAVVGSQDVFQTTKLLFFEPVSLRAGQADNTSSTPVSYSTVGARIAESLVRQATRDDMPFAVENEGLREIVATAEVELDGRDHHLVYIRTESPSEEHSIEAAQILTGALRDRFASIESAVDAVGVFFVVDRWVEVEVSDVVETVEREVVVGPSRTTGVIITIVSGLGGFFLAIFLAFVLNYISRIRKDPESLARIRGE